ncbi:MAG TPA: thioredoxin family protein [Acidimicrobiia bacterium]
MTVRLIMGAAILVVVGVVAWRMRQRSPDAPPRDVYPVPRQLDRGDFPRPEAPWLVALFSSTVCDSCRGLGPKITVMESVEVAVCEVEAADRGDLHRRYELAAIPTTVIADADGVVRRGFVGAFTATDIWSAVAELRAPGSTPEPDLGTL